MLLRLILLILLATTLTAAISGSHQPAQQTLDQHTITVSFPSSPNILRLNFSSPFPLIFHSLFTLLHQWPQTFYPNSHTIAPCTIPPNTNLYHARRDAETPPSPEWFAFDAEMSYGIAGLGETSHMLTYRTTREVRCLYFDGTSASLMRDGSMDAQMLLLHNTSANVPEDPGFGRPPPGRYNESRPYPGQPQPCRPGSDDTNCEHWNPIQAEYDRASGLCDFIKNQSLGGLGWGYEGVVRMNAGFEMIWCNFSSPSARLVSNIAVHVPPLDAKDDFATTDGALGGDRYTSSYDAEVHEGTGSALHDAAVAIVEPSPLSKGHRGPPGMRIDHPFTLYSLYAWFQAASKRYGFAGVGHPGQGETRVRIDSAAIFTFYDPGLVHQEGVRVAEERERFNLTKQGRWAGSGVEREAMLKKLERRRTGQRVLNVTVEDGDLMHQAVLERMKQSIAAGGSGIEWISTAREIVLMYSGPLLDLRTLLATITKFTTTDEESDTAKALFALTKSARNVLHGLWMPYYEYQSFSQANLTEAFHPAALESSAAFERCKTQYEPEDIAAMTKSENATYTAISEVLTSICGTLLPAFLNTETVWLKYYNNYTLDQPINKISTIDLPIIQHSLLHTYHTIQELMAWLGWSDQWTTCSPACNTTQVCAIPMWPLSGVVITDPWDRDEYEYDVNEEDERRERRGPMEAGGLERALWEPGCVDAEIVVKRWERRRRKGPPRGGT